MAVFVLAFSVFATVSGPAAAWKPELIEREREIAEALAAGPTTIRGQAGIYVLTSAGFELVRDSGNGFHCLVERSQPGAFEPQCFDAEGSSTLLQQVPEQLRRLKDSKAPSVGSMVRDLIDEWGIY